MWKESEKAAGRGSQPPPGEFTFGQARGPHTRSGGLSAVRNGGSALACPPPPSPPPSFLSRPTLLTVAPPPCDVTCAGVSQLQEPQEKGARVCRSRSCRCVGVWGLGEVWAPRLVCVLDRRAARRVTSRQLLVSVLLLFDCVVIAVSCRPVGCAALVAGCALGVGLPPPPPALPPLPTSHVLAKCGSPLPRSRVPATHLPMLLRRQAPLPPWWPR
jgi:hypothetical protein